MSGRADAVGAGVAAAEHQYTLTFSDNPLGTAEPLSRVDAVLLGEKLHRQVDAIQIPAGYRQVAGYRGTPCETYRVELRPEPLNLDVPADVGARAERDPLGLHLVDAALDYTLLQLELRDAEPKKSADVLVALEHGDAVTRAV